MYIDSEIVHTEGIFITHQNGMIDSPFCCTGFVLFLITLSWEMMLEASQQR